MMFDPHKGQWWNADPARMFEAYYMTLRVHYEMPALEAYNYARQHGAAVGVGTPGGVIGLMRAALNTHNAGNERRPKGVALD
jgi:hypothetical protein